MSQRERENPRRVRGSRREEGGVCGHRVPSAFERPTQQDFPPPFPQRSSRISSTLDNAPSGEILKALGVTHVLDTVPACKNLYKNSFTYHCFQADKILQFDNAIQF